MKYEPRDRRRGNSGNRRLGIDRGKCSDQKAVGVSADTDDDPCDGVGGEGRVVEIIIGSCNGRGTK